MGVLSVIRRSSPRLRTFDVQPGSCAGQVSTIIAQAANTTIATTIFLKLNIGRYLNDFDDLRLPV